MGINELKTAIINHQINIDLSMSYLAFAFSEFGSGLPLCCDEEKASS